MSTRGGQSGLLRDLGPQVLAVLARRTGDFAAAEDAVQEALAAAASTWPFEGLPQSPKAWLVRVAQRRMTDALRADVARQRREAELAADFDEVAPDGDTLPDDALALLFMCSHPALTRPSAIALTLRAVGGLGTAEIAHAFMVPEATMAQRISRAKATIKQSGIAFELPNSAERHDRLGTVLHVLYLIFNEGYTTSSGPELLRTDLADEAIRLTRQLHRALPDGEVSGLLALMLLTDARRDARTGPNGELIPLDEQDRTRWDRASIDEGTALVSASLSRSEPGPYQVQAAIAALHDEAASAAATDWPQILALYDVLLGLADNPMVALNRIVALGMVQGADVALGALDADRRLEAHHRWHAVRAHFLEKVGRFDEAVVAYRSAAAKTESTPERDYLIARALASTGRVRS